MKFPIASNILNLKTFLCLIVISYRCNSFQTKTNIGKAFLSKNCNPNPVGKTSIHSSSKFNNEENAIDETTKQSRRSFFRNVVISSGIIAQGIGITKPQKSNALLPGKLGGLSNKIRRVSLVMDELQRDLMQERWDLIETYPAQLRAYVPVFTSYTDTAFASDAATDKSLRVALRYEVGRFFASLERLRQAAARRSLDDCYIAYSDMAVHYDRYLHTGDLYTYTDDLISTEPFFQNVTDASLIFSDPVKDPPEVRDLILLASGPDKGKTGIMIGIYKDGSQNCVVKLDKYRSKYGIREIRVVPRKWVAKRLGEQDPDAVFLLPRRSAKERSKL